MAMKDVEKVRWILYKDLHSLNKHVFIYMYMVPAFKKNKTFNWTIKNQCEMHVDIVAMNLTPVSPQKFNSDVIILIYHPSSWS